MKVLAIDSPSDVRLAGDLAKLLAERMGFSSRRSVEVGIVACELASNVYKHAEGGELQILLERELGELTLVACDSGPAFRDLANAFRDGWDDSGPIDPTALHGRSGIGGGLGAIARLADAVDVRQEADSKAITARFAIAPPGSAGEVSR